MRESWNALMQEIGFVVITSARLEAALGELYADLLESPVAAVVAPGLGFDGTQQAIRAVLKARTEKPAREEILAALDEAQRLYGDRSHVVHAARWTSTLSTVNGERQAGAPEGHPHHATRRRRWQTEGQRRSWCAEELHELGLVLRDLARRMEGFAGRGPE